MTTYSTQNPIGSSDPRDLYDNAENLDSLVNGDQAAYSDRLGKSRRSWQSVEDQVNQQAAEFNAAQDDREGVFNAYLVSAGYQFAGDYAAGIEITQYNQVVRDTSGEFWRISGSTTLPYTTTGAGLPEGGAFVAVGDAVLRQELGLEGGALLVKGAVIYVDSFADLPTSGLVDGQSAIVRGSEFRWSLGASQWLSDGEVNAKAFGVSGDGIEDDFPAFKAAIESGYNIYFPPGQYKLNNITSYIKPQDNQALTFAAGAEVVIPPTATVSTGFSSGNPLLGRDSSDGALSGFSITGGKFLLLADTPLTLLKILPTGSKDLKFCELAFDGAGNEANTKADSVFDASYVSRLSFIDCEINYTRSGAIISGTSEHVLVRGCKITHAGINVTYPKNDIPSAVSGVDYWNSSAVSLVSSSFCRIENNFFDWTGGTCIMLRTGYTSTLNNIVSGNSAYNLGKSLVGFGMPTYVTSHVTSEGHVCTDNYVAGCLYNLVGAALDVGRDGDWGICRDIKISGNTIISFNRGQGQTEHPVPQRAELGINISAEGSSSPEPIERVKVVSNVVSGFSLRGISVVRAGDVDVKNNTLTDCCYATGSGGEYPDTFANVQVIRASEIFGRTAILDNRIVRAFKDSTDIFMAVIAIRNARSGAIVEVFGNSLDNPAGYDAGRLLFVTQSSGSVTVAYKDAYSNKAVIGGQEVRLTGNGQIKYSASSLLDRPVVTALQGQSAPTSDFWVGRSSIITGSGDPEGVVSAGIGAIYMRTSGGISSTFYVKEADNGAPTGWAAK